jgi:hypothetical protein
MRLEADQDAAVIPAQAGIQSSRLAPDLVFGVKACSFIGQRLTQSLVLTESFLFALKASHFSLFAQRKVTKRKCTPTLAPAAPVPGLGEVLGARADTTSCRDGTFADVLSAQPLRAPPSPALHEGEGVGFSKDIVLPVANLLHGRHPRCCCCFPTLVRCRPKGRAQGIARQGCRASAVTTGRRVGAYPEHGPSGGDRRNAPAPSRGVISFGYFSLHEQRKVTRRQGEKKAFGEEVRFCNPPTSSRFSSLGAPH